MNNRVPTVLITGCSSGFGLATARCFHDRGWQVVATMRTPREDALPNDERMRVLALDVTDASSIERAVEVAGPIDVLVNNAGIGLLGVVESTPMTMVREIFETNTFGTMAMTQAVLPQFRQRRSGVVVNVTSSVTLRALPLLAVYTASKAAIDAYTASLALELAPFGVRARLVLPGRAPATRFGENAMPRMQAGFAEPYAAFAHEALAPMRDPAAPVTVSQDVTAAVWRAATDPACPLRMPAGADAVAEVAARH